MSYALLGYLAVSLISSAIGAGLSAWAANNNVQAQRDINEQNVQNQQAINTQNVQAQKEINEQNIAYSREFAQNQVQWKMADLEAAGLNPTLAAGGFSGGASPSVLSAPRQQAAMQQAPMLDMSGVSSALTAMSNMMMTSALLSQRNDNYADRNDILREKYLNSGVFRKMNAASTMVHSAKQLERGMSSSDLKAWKKLLDDLSASRPKDLDKHFWEK